MKRLKWRLIKFYSLFILMLLAILVFLPSCEKETINRPTAKFIIKGTVISDEDQKPLKNMLVIMIADTLKIDTAKTSQNGSFEVIDSLGIPAEVCYNLMFINMKDKSIVSIEKFKFTNPDFSNADGHWYFGETTKTHTFKLKTKHEKRPMIINNDISCN